MSSSCPTCRQTLPQTTELLIDPAGIVVRNGRFAVLTVHEMELLMSLQSAAPRVRTHEQILSDLYWKESDEPGVKIIDVYICKLRKKLKPLGVVIETVWGRGYRMLPLAPAREAA